ncbi:MAG: hypothetical protein PHD61_04400 [Bacteroidales bacterium]|nr:hypothetical protein [Lentimicrobiaceae bacterium]MDD5694530.1 hypothetical protein [Bacteroidales bacterium]
MRIRPGHLLNTYVILLITAILVIVSLNINSGKDYRSGMIMSDGKGYYAYLPAIFIYHDLHFNFFDKIEKETYSSEYHYYDYRATVDGRIINKYYAGTALAMLPFFGIGQLLSVVSGNPLDGYSTHYTMAINFAAICYLAIGLLFLCKLLRTYQIRRSYISLILAVIVFGTNLFYYTVVEFAMSHVYSFAFATLFLYFSRQYFQRHSSRDLIWAGLMLGMIALIRPVNLLILLVVPFLAGSRKDLLTGWIKIRHNVPALIISVLAFLAVFSIQLIIYRIQTGDFWVYSYGQERFLFNQPHMLAILFSYKKGLFVYTPLILISLTGLYFLWKHDRFTAWWLFGFLFLLTYILSSWWMWYYGGSFSSRVYIEYFSLFAILLGVTLEGLTRKIPRRMYITLMIVLTLFCQIQTYQYRYYFIHWSDMTREKYWDVFMRIDLLIDKGQ